MKLNTYKSVGFLIAAFFISGLYAQKFDKKYTEKFKVNKDVLLAINANNADINVTTWNKNEVAVEAIITVEGLSKKEAQKYLKGWDFEALGNRKKVSIKTHGDRFVYFGDNSFNFDFDMPEVIIPDMKFDFDMPEIDIPEIVIPDIKIDFQNIWNGIDDMDFDEDDERTFSFVSKGKNKTVVIKSKKDWEKFKKSDDFKELKKSLKVSLTRAKERIGKIDKKKIKEEIAKARVAVKSINKEKLEKSLAKARVAIEKMKVKMAKNYKNGENIFIIENDNSKKKVKITKKILIKVPKNATYDLNTRHSKVKLPKGKTSGKVSYGTFNSDGLQGGSLKIYSAPVDINTLNACTLFLNNVTDANLASVSNTILNTDSSGVKIKNVFNDVNVTSKFDELLVENFNPNFGKFILNLTNSDADIKISNVKTSMEVNTNKGKFSTYELGFLDKVFKKYESSFKFSHKEKNTSNNFILTSNYSNIILR